MKNIGSFLRRLGVLICLGAAVHRGAAAEAVFHRAFNLNGPSLTIDGQAWEGNDASGISINGSRFANQAVPLKPPTDPARSEMIRSSVWGGKVDIEVSSLDSELSYQVLLYVWEDNHSERFNILVNDQVVLDGFHSGNGGSWKRLGPWKTQPRSGKIKVSARGGAANLSGLEIWIGDGDIPAPETAKFVTALSAEQTEFFEKRIRPLLVQHCYECHSAEAKELKGGLLLDSRAGVIKGGHTGAIITPGYPGGSLLIHAVKQGNKDLAMPPDGKLSDQEISDLETWVKMGAPDTRTADTIAIFKAKTAIDWNKAREFWSFRPRTSPTPPPVNQTGWPANEIDHFILAKIEAAGLPLAPDAEKRVLIRRATYDLTGLPPTPDEIEAFLTDQSPDAFARVVDRLLGSAAYGERWGRHWLDVVRYADTAGDNSDFPIPQMYRYRNWVIDAFNRDLPYDEFIRQQIAGDLLPAENRHETEQRIIATGYLANARRFGSRVADYPQHLTIEDTIDNLGRAFLGLTVSCARCHNHKFDPITAEDYYAIYGIFHSTQYPWPGIELDQVQRDLVPLGPRENYEQAKNEHAGEQEKLDAIVKELAEQAKQVDGDEKKTFEKKLAEARKAAERHKKEPLPIEMAYAVSESHKVEDVPLQHKGDPAKPGQVVRRGFLKVLNEDEVPEDAKTSGRLLLADWIADPENPLTARVMANRIWHYHFGSGIVQTPNDFGKQGKPPTHPELLDWLATYFVDSGWSIKSMHRTIMLSRTYRMASGLSSIAADKDPNNELLSAFPRRRLNAEAIRDTLLVLGGGLDTTPGGPHPFPPQTNWNFTQHNPFKAVYESNRRSVYLMTQRIQRHPYLAVFDGADPAASTAVRTSSTTPLQALYLLNDSFVHEQSKGFAARLVTERSTDADRWELACALALGRTPQPGESESALQILASIKTSLRESGTAADQLDFEAWQAMARGLFRMNEFVYID